MTIAPAPVALFSHDNHSPLLDLLRPHLPRSLPLYSTLQTPGQPIAVYATFPPGAEAGGEEGRRRIPWLILADLGNQLRFFCSYEAKTALSEAERSEGEELVGRALRLYLLEHHGGRDRAIHSFTPGLLDADSSHTFRYKHRSDTGHLDILHRALLQHQAFLKLGNPLPSAARCCRVFTGQRIDERRYCVTWRRGRDSGKGGRRSRGEFTSPSNAVSSRPNVLNIQPRRFSQHPKYHILRLTSRPGCLTPPSYAPSTVPRLLPPTLQPYRPPLPSLLIAQHTATDPSAPFMSPLHIASAASALSSFAHGYLACSPPPRRHDMSSRSGGAPQRSATCMRTI
ncbi:hypothetical protein BJY59DRAFT_691927 [Rhodotorula toruloides]